MGVMLYSHGGPHKIHGDEFDYIIVDENDVEDAIKKGWAETTPEAIAKKKAAVKKAAKTSKAKD